MARVSSYKRFCRFASQLPPVVTFLIKADYGRWSGFLSSRLSLNLKISQLNKSISMWKEESVEISLRTGDVQKCHL